MQNNSNKKETDIAVRKWQQHITKYFYDCTDEILDGLADIYVADPRFTKNIDKSKEGLAEYMSKAIKEYLLKR